MITGLLFKALCAVASFVLGLFPGAGDLPTWVANIPDTMQTIVNYEQQLGNWFPLGAMALAGSFVIFCYALNVAIRLFRIATSYATFGGGGAG